MKKLTMGSLFAGIGGFEISATWAGIQPIWSNEIDPWCCKVLRKNFNHEIIEKDIRLLIANAERNGGDGKSKEYQNGWNPLNKDERDKVGNESINLDKIKSQHEIKKPDILTGGFPCQPFSHAGKRKGKDDNRYLWPEYLRLIRELQPPWIIAENVAGLISMENGRTLEGILLDLENENYTPEIYNIPACGVGAWHKRERIWIVCHSTKPGFSNRGSTQMGQSEKVEKFKRSGNEYDSNPIELNDDNTRYGSGSICGIGQTEAEIQGCEDVTNTSSQRRKAGISRQIPGKERQSGIINDNYSKRRGQNIWSTEPNVGRVANGISGRVDKLKGLGNAIVPQVAYELFKAILEYEQNYLNEEDYK